MATITPVIGHEVLIQIGDGETPEVFSHPVLINNNRAITFTTATETDELPDATNQALPAQTFRRVRAFDTKIDGSGMLEKSAVHDFIQWQLAGTVKNVKAIVGNSLVTGPFVLSSFGVSGERTKTCTCEITLEQAGPCTATEIEDD